MPRVAVPNRPVDASFDSSILRKPVLRFLCILTVSFGISQFGMLAQVGNAADFVTISGETMGTTYTIKARSTSDNLDGQRLKTKIDERLAEIDRQMSTWRNDSEVSTFNAAPANEWFSVSEATVRVVKLADEISRDTDGAFDITIGPIVALWNFGAAGERLDFTPPSDQQIASTLESVGRGKLQFRLSPPALMKSVDDLQVDLSAIAKGFGVDVISEALAANQIEHFMVEIGGEVRVRGSRRDGSAWRIGVENPNTRERRLGSIVSLQDEAMATSGDYRNFFELDGVTYSHTINSKTGRPVQHKLAAVSVIAETCAKADALATAILAMGPEVGYQWAQQRSVKALLLSRDGEVVTRQTTGDFPDHPLPAESNNTMSSLLQIIVMTTIVIGIAVFAMSIGTIVANRRIQGSCGGLAGIKDEHGKTLCEACTKPSPECAGVSTDDAGAAEPEAS